jgi:hypothetical protein
MKNSDYKEQSCNVYIPKRTKDKESPCNHSKPMGTAHPINVLDMTSMGKIVKKLFGLK